MSGKVVVVGQTQTSTWQGATHSPLLSSTVYGGETVDFTLPSPEFFPVMCSPALPIPPGDPGHPTPAGNRTVPSGDTAVTPPCLSLSAQLNGSLLVSQMMPAVAYVQLLPVGVAHQISSDVVTLDFQQNAAGRLKLSLPGMTNLRSTSVTLTFRHAELVFPNNSINPFTNGGCVLGWRLSE